MQNGRGVILLEVQAKALSEFPQTALSSDAFSEPEASATV